MELIWLTILMICVVHVVGGITGFGSSLLAVAAIALILGGEAIGEWRAVLALCGLLQASMIVIEAYRSIVWKELASIMIFAVMGLPVGSLLLTELNGLIIHLVLGVLLIIGGSLALLKNFEFQMPVPVRVLVLFLVGLIHGGFVSGGTLLIPYAKLSINDKDAFRATLACVWLMLNSVLLVMVLFESQWSIQIPWYLLVLTCLGIIGATFLGQRLVARLEEKKFSGLAAGCMIAAGLIYMGNQLIGR